jgi:hypothetical protein
MLTEGTLSYYVSGLWQAIFDPFECSLLEAHFVYFYIVATVRPEEASFPPCRQGDTHAELIDAYGMGHKR